MIRDNNRRQGPGMSELDNWALRSTEPDQMATVHLSAGDITLVDISLEGIGLRTHKPILKDAIITFDLCFSNKYHRITAKVLWTTKGPVEWRSGLQIIFMSDELMVEIEDYLEGNEKRNAVN